MAKSILLNTNTVNFLDLLGNGKVYRVPPYQRDYSWEEEQWEDLWNDVLDRCGRKEERHYMGALVVEGVSDREFSIIDGQQRLATLSIIALAVLQRLKALADAGTDADANKERMTELRKRFIGEKDPASLIESSKLNLNENDNAFYQDYLVQLRPPINPRGLSQSNKLLWECFKYYSREIDKKPELVSNGESLATLLSETIARQLLFILITVDDELNAYTVFETLNARGLELSATDLLKNYLFSKVKVPSDLLALQRRWRLLVNTVRQERFPEFLRYHLLCEHPKIRTQRLFKLVREKVRTPEEVFHLIDALETRAELFAAISDPNHEYWIDRPECRPYIRDLKLFRVRQLTPLLFAAWERFNSDNFARVLKIVSIITFRYTVVTGRNTNELEPVSHAAAKAVLSGVATGPADVFRSLESIYVDDDSFKQAFSVLEISTQGQKKKLAKYVLCRLETDVSGRTCDPDTDPATIEHILPENPGSEWEDAIPQEQWEKYVYRVGNLTLLEAGANRDVGNGGYPAKLEKYRVSTYGLAAKIVQNAPSQWTAELLTDRQKRLAERAAHVWRSDFA
jgi:hypothetical protein